MNFINDSNIIITDLKEPVAYVQITTSGWPTGMYFVRMVFMNESVAEGKVVINKR